MNGLAQERKLNGISTSLVAFRLLQEPRIISVSLNEAFADQLRAVISRPAGPNILSLPKMKNSDLRNSDGAVVARWTRTPQRPDDLYALFFRRFFYRSL